MKLKDKNNLPIRWQRSAKGSPSYEESITSRIVRGRDCGRVDVDDVATVENSRRRFAVFSLYERILQFILGIVRLLGRFDVRERHEGTTHVIILTELHTLNLTIPVTISHRTRQTCRENRLHYNK